MCCPGIVQGYEGFSPCCTVSRALHVLLPMHDRSPCTIRAPVIVALAHSAGVFLTADAFLAQELPFVACTASSTETHAKVYPGELHVQQWHTFEEDVRRFVAGQQAALQGVTCSWEVYNPGMYAVLQAVDGWFWYPCEKCRIKLAIHSYTRLCKIMYVYIISLGFETKSITNLSKTTKGNHRG